MNTNKMPGGDEFLGGGEYLARVISDDQPNLTVLGLGAKLPVVDGGVLCDPVLFGFPKSDQHISLMLPASVKEFSIRFAENEFTRIYVGNQQ